MSAAVSTVAWRVGTVIEARPETSSARRIVLDVPDWPGNDAGQHLDVRLTAADGYQVQRSYSVASAGPGSRVELAVDELPNGEASPFLVEDLQLGDKLEVNGPLGGYFIWTPQSVSRDSRPVQLIAGGSGVVPFVAMVRAHAASADPTPFRLLYAVREPGDVFYRQELIHLALSGLKLDFIYSRATPMKLAGPRRPNHPKDSRRFRDPRPREAARLCVRLDWVRRARVELAGRSRVPGGRYPHRAIRRQLIRDVSVRHCERGWALLRLRRELISGTTT